MKSFRKIHPRDAAILNTSVTKKDISNYQKYSINLLFNASYSSATLTKKLTYIFNSIHNFNPPGLEEFSKAAEAANKVFIKLKEKSDISLNALEVYAYRHNTDDLNRMYNTEFNFLKNIYAVATDYIPDTRKTWHMIPDNIRQRIADAMEEFSESPANKGYMNVDIINSADTFWTICENISFTDTYEMAQISQKLDSMSNIMADCYKDKALRDLITPHNLTILKRNLHALCKDLGIPTAPSHTADISPDCDLLWLDPIFKKEASNLPVPQPTSSAEDTATQNIPDLLGTLVTDKSDKQNKQQSKKAAKSRKQAAASAFTDLENHLVEKDEKLSVLLAELMKHSIKMAVVQEELYIYSKRDGCFHKCSCNQASMRLRSLLHQELQIKVGPGEYKQAYKMLILMEELNKPDDFFAYNTPYVCCANGVYDINCGKLVDHSPSFAFRNCIQAKYDPDAECPKFHEYLRFITSGDGELIHLWRVVLGYLWSNYTNAKTAVLVFGYPNTGKSVMCNLLERVVGAGQVSHVDIGLMHRMEFAASTDGKLLNIVPDLKNQKLQDIGYFKSLVSHLDTISARFLYGNPKEIKSQTKMLFATNHLLEFDGSSTPDDVLAVFNRLLYLPYTNPPITAAQDNKNLADELYAERDGIFTWAMNGLEEYVDTQNFPVSQKSLDLKAQNMERYCPEQTFCTTFLKPVDGAYASSLDIRDAYSDYCRTHSIRRTRKLDILTYIDQTLGYSKVKKRLPAEDGEIHNIWCYENLSLLEPVDEESEDL